MGPEEWKKMNTVIHNHSVTISHTKRFAKIHILLQLASDFINATQT